MTDQFVSAGRRQTALVRRRLDRLGPLAGPLALLLTLPSWTLVPVLIAIVGIWRAHPVAYSLVALSVAVGGAAGAMALVG